MKHRVFISYAHAQQAEAELVCGRLEADGVSTWLATRDISAGSDWVDRLPAAVEAAEIVVVLLSHEALVSEWVDRELNWAVTKRRPLLPVIIGDARLTERLRFLFGTVQQSRFPARATVGDADRLVRDVRALLQDEQLARDFVSEAEVTEVPRPPDAFTNRVTVARPALFVLLVDRSSSMNRTVPALERPAREAVAEVVNEFLFELLRKATRPDGHRHFFDIAIFGYGFGRGKDEIVSQLATEDWVAVGDLYDRWESVKPVSRNVVLEDGSIKSITVNRPIWVTLAPGKGNTVMAQAFRRAHSVVGRWIESHPDSLPPVVLNISDGGWTGENPVEAVRALQEQSTTLGPTLIFNCQLGTTQTTESRGQLLFPSEIPPEYPARTRELWLLSSQLPETMHDEARERGLDIQEGARGLVYNAPVTRLVDFLQVSTQTRV